MSLTERLQNLEQKNSLQTHDAPPAEIRQHLDNAIELLEDAKRGVNSLGTRFSVANNAGHALLMAAIKMHGYRPTTAQGHRQILYQLLDGLAPAATAAQETLSKAHNKRNRIEYEGVLFGHTQSEIDGIIEAAENVLEEVELQYKTYKKTHDAGKTSA